MDHSKPKRSDGFIKKIWMAGGILALIVVILLLIRATFSVLLLILAGILIAVFFRGLSGLIHRQTRWKEGVCLLISVLSSFIILGLLMWLAGSKIQAQTNQLSETLPQTLEHARAWLNRSAFGRLMVEQFSSAEAQQKAKTVFQTFFKSTFGVLGDVYVVLFIGIFFTVNPKIYKTGIIKLVQPQARDRASHVLDLMGENLRKWLKGKLFAMLVVAIFTAVGLVIMGIPMWLVLALIAGLLNFIPNFGPLIALIPAVLVALLQGPVTALWVAGLYIVVQIVESNFITPMVQQRLVSIPPALIIIAQLLMAPLTGGWGLILATPLMVIMMVAINELYIKTMEQKP